MWNVDLVENATFGAGREDDGDPLRAARGITLGVIIGLCLWGVILYGLFALAF